MLDILGDLDTFEGASPAQVSNIQKAYKSSLCRLKRNNQITSAQFQSYTSNLSNTPYIYGLPKPTNTRILSEAWVDVNVTDEYGATALMNASSRRKLSNVRMLLNAGANINVRDNSGLTPLENAIKNSNLSVIRLLVENGAEVDINENS
ncbi:hypothetical protein LAZ67_12002383, partial [Cordylochernes scorpioides]